MPVSLTITPAEFTIGGADQTQRVLVMGPAKVKSAARQFDYSRKATYTSSDAKVATVGADGLVKPVGNGACSIQAVVGGQSATAKVTVKDFDVTPPVSFRNQIVPIFTKLGCNSGGCHGKATRPERLQAVAAGFRPAIRLQRHRQRGAGPAQSSRAARAEPAAAQGDRPGAARRRQEDLRANQASTP